MRPKITYELQYLVETPNLKEWILDCDPYRSKRSALAALKLCRKSSLHQLRLVKVHSEILKD